MSMAVVQTDNHWLSHLLRHRTSELQNWSELVLEALPSTIMPFTSHYKTYSQSKNEKNNQRWINIQLNIYQHPQPWLGILDLMYSPLLWDLCCVCLHLFMSSSVIIFFFPADAIQFYTVGQIFQLICFDELPDLCFCLHSLRLLGKPPCSCSIVYSSISLCWSCFGQLRVISQVSVLNILMNPYFPSESCK